MRIAAIIEYNGKNFHGWEKQKGLTRTVQGEVEQALSKIANEKINTICAGRTDAGVHAQGQVIHFDSKAERNVHNWLAGTNSILAHDVALKQVMRVKNDFHARYGASARIYRYHIVNRQARPALLADFCWWLHVPLSVDKMRTAAACLIGEHDFSAFRAASCQANTPMRNIKRIDCVAHNEDIFIEVEGNAFLHHMVRNIVGSLVEVGSGKRPAEWLKDVLKSKNRPLAGPTAPARGLTLLKVNYY